MPDRTHKPPGLLARAAAFVLPFVERKAASAFRHSGRGGGSGGAWWGDGRSSIVIGMPGDDRDAAADAGDLWMNSVVAACLGWLTDQFPEPFAEVYSLADDGDYEARPRHDLIDLLEFPNPAYDADALWAATVLSYQITGNAYWIKVRNRARTEVLELWHVPSYEMAPAWPDDGSVFVSHFVHTVDGVAYDIPIEDVVHFRRGMDPNNPRIGLSPLGAVIREVATDNEASIYEAAVLRNKGIIGGLIQPAEAGDEFAPGEGEILVNQLHGKTTGTNRGRFVAVNARVDLKEFGRSPGEMGLGAIRNIPASRICAVTGVNEQVLGLAGGKEHNTYENQAAATRGAYNRGLIPVQRSFAKTITRQLLWADFKGRRGVDYVAWNYSEVAALSEDATGRITRAVLAWDALLIKRGEACEEAGFNPPAPEDDVYKPSQAVAQAVANADARDDGLINESVTGGNGEPGANGDGTPAAGDGEAEEGVPPGRLRLAKALARSTNGHATHASPEREDGTDPFLRLRGQIARLAAPAGRPTAPHDREMAGTKATPFLDPEDDDDFLIDLRPTGGTGADTGENPGWGEDDGGDEAEGGPDESNTYNLPTGRPIADKLREFFDAQLKDVLGTARTIGADLGDPATWAAGAALPAIPTGLGDYDRPMAQAMTPLIGAYWDESGRRTMARLGLDPDDWRVVDPNTRAKIEGAALAFSRSTNETTSKDLRGALDTLREELAAGIVDRGEALPQLTKRVQGVFEGASKDRAKVIAETEASRAVHAAQLESARQSTVVWGKKLLLSSDACQEICQMAYASMPENGWPLDDPMHDDGRGHPQYSVAPSPPLHPRCRCALTLVTFDDIGLPTPGAGPISPAGDEAAPEPEPAREPGPAARPGPRPSDPIGGARYDQRRANREAARSDPGHARLLRKYPDLIPDGPIGERIKKYSLGEAKADAILALGGRVAEAEAPLAAERTGLGRAMSEALRKQSALVDPYVSKGKPVPPKVREKALALQVDINAAAARREEIRALQAALDAERRAAVLGILRVEGGLAFRSADVPDGYASSRGPLLPLDERTRASVAAAEEWLRAVVATSDATAIETRVGRGDDYRAHFSDRGDHMQLATNEGPGVVVHEYGHAIDYRLRTGPDVAVDRSREFLRHRVGTEVPTDIHGRFGKGNPGEMGRKDRFDDYFEESEAYYVGKDYGGDATEILSMGLQAMYNDPVRFVEKDREYALYVMGILDSSLR